MTLDLHHKIKIIKFINSEISKDCLWVNRKDNSKNGTSLGYHVLKIIKTSAIPKLFEAGYGVTANNVPLEDSSSLDVIFFCDGQPGWSCPSWCG